ncbi:MAG: hypothetical protein DRJ52_09485 [Thermoprotei archaeon]|nr:MAG: hypothetical protein DRJ52_09485 [Thermoprotei archaeon]
MAEGPRIEKFKYIFSVNACNEEKYVTFIETCSGHKLIVDEPIKCGGEGRGPNPIELFLASIASCFIISVKMHAARLKIPIDHIDVYVEGRFDIRGFLAIKGFEPGFEKIVLKAKIKSSADETTVKKIVEKALKGWVTGSTVQKAIPIDIQISIEK